MWRNALTIAGILVLSVISTAPALADNDTVKISTGDHDYNRFTFNSAFKTVILPPDVALASEPVSLGGNTTLLLDFKASLKKPVQMVVQMVDGDVYDFKLVPGGKSEATWEEPGGPNGTKPVERPTDKALIKIFKEVLADPTHPPGSFTRMDTPSPGKIDDLTADYTAAYKGKNFKIYVMRLRADHPSPILPQDLYVRGVKAVYIGGDAVGPNLAPMAVVLAANNGGD